MELTSEEFIAAHSDAELLRMAYRYDTDEPDLQTAAEAELRRRNMLPEDFAERKQKLIDEEDEKLENGRNASFPQQFFGWLGIFGLLGIIIGYDLYFSKATSIYTRHQYYRYDDESRESGRYMFYISLLTHSLFLIWKFGPVVQRYFEG